MKVKAKDLKEGDVFLIGKKKCIVRTIAVVPVPVTRNVDTAVLTYTPVTDDENDKDGEVIIDHHLAASKKVEVIPPGIAKRFWSIFSKPTPTPKKEEPKVQSKADLPFFVRK